MMKLVECIPNFSVSRERDEAAFNALVDTAKALVDCAEYYLKLENFDCHKQVMEYHLVGME